jgi:hypothetical protein
LRNSNTGPDAAVILNFIVLIKKMQFALMAYDNDHTAYPKGKAIPPEGEMTQIMYQYRNKAILMEWGGAYLTYSPCFLRATTINL